MDNLTGHNIKGYERRERIGTGGFGAVYKAYQSTVGREVAMKIILPGFANHPDFIRRFETEAQLVARLEHLHITPLYDYWRDPDGAYLVMRWLKGGSLCEALEQGAYSVEAAALLMDQITSALAAAHRSKVIHRDLKPGNILLDEDGNAYLADFGIAKDLCDVRPSMTEPDAVIGSLDDIVDTYAEYRLLSLDHDPRTRTPTVEVAHEAILREWERLRAWLNENREDMGLQRQLMALTEEWRNAQHDASFLLRGSRLEIFENWMHSTQLVLTEKERDYLDTSLKQRSIEQTAEAARKAKEQLTAHRAQNFQRASWILGIFVVLAIAASILIALSAINAQSAVTAANLTIEPIPSTLTAVAVRIEDAQAQVESLRLASLANDQLLNGNVETAALLGIRALNRTDTDQANAVLVRSLDQSFTLAQFDGHLAVVFDVAFSPDGRYILSGSYDNTARLWDTDYRDFVAYACTRIFRDFTDVERQQFELDDTPTCPQFGGWTTAPTATPIATAVIPV